MNTKKFLALALISFSFGKCYTHAENNDSIIEVRADESQDSIFDESPNEQNNSLSLYFDNFLKMVALLYTSPEKVNPIELIDHMIITLVHMSGELTALAHEMQTDEKDMLKLMRLNPTLAEKLFESIEQYAFAVKRCAKPECNAEKDRQEVEAILHNFKGCIGAFFNIVREPENKENVFNGLAVMLSHIVMAGKVIMAPEKKISEEQRLLETISNEEKLSLAYYIKY